MKLHGEEVKVGDKVWHILRGWGEVTNLDSEKYTNYPICVKFGEDYNWFTKDGKFRSGDTTPVLFWQPVEFEIPKKPKPKEKAWQWICKWGDKYWITNCHYASKEEATCVSIRESTYRTLPPIRDRKRGERMNKPELKEGNADRQEPPYTCQYCGSPSWLHPSDQTPPPDYCHESDHGSADDE